MIRPATKEDIKEIAEIFIKEYSKEPYNENWSEEYALKKIETYFNDNIIFVAKIENKVIGFIIVSTYLWADGMRGLVDEVVISKEFQSKGVGTKLMQEIERHFSNKGIKKIYLTTHKSARAVDFYEKLGYRKSSLINFIKELNL